MPAADILKRAAIWIGLGVAAFLVWELRELILLITGALVLATLLQLGSEPILRWTPLPRPVALAISTLAIVALCGWVIYLFGTQTEAQLSDVLQRASAGLSTVHARLQQSQLGRLLLDNAGAALSITSLLTPVLTIGVEAIEAALVVVVSAIYIAAQPAIYRRGLVTMFPRSRHAWADETIADIGAMLRLWLIGQLIETLLIGLLSLIAVWLIGLPSPLALGLIAGVCEFIPYVGPVLAAIPALLVAITISNSAAFWTLIAFILIHQTEGHVILPLVQRYLVFIPPAAMLLGLAGVTLLFGQFGMVFAAPLVVMLFAALRKLYYRDVMGEAAPLPVDHHA
jgi:predicted PurR-regulated permease PerM